jgi:hypothetical protein
MWERMATVLRKSARRQCPGWELDIAQGERLDLNSPLGLDHNVYNTLKLNAWRKAVESAKTGERMMLADVDVAILQPLDDVWDQSFDVAITNKPAGSRMPFNAGIVFLRVSPAVKTFMGRWADENWRMFQDPSFHQVWRPYYGGINQAALGYLMRQGGHDGLNLQRLPCAEWNLEDEHWSQFDPERTRIVHYKTELRRALFDKRAAVEAWQPLIQAWKAIESEEEVEPEEDETPVEDERQILPIDITDTMVRQSDLSIPQERPPLSRKQRREAMRTPGGRDARA